MCGELDEDVAIVARASGAGGESAGGESVAFSGRLPSPETEGEEGIVSCWRGEMTC